MINMEIKGKFFTQYFFQFFQRFRKYFGQIIYLWVSNVTKEPSPSFWQKPYLIRPAACLGNKNREIFTFMNNIFRSYRSSYVHLNIFWYHCQLSVGVW